MKDTQGNGTRDTGFQQNDTQNIVIVDVVILNGIMRSVDACFDKHQYAKYH